MLHTVEYSTPIRLDRFLTHLYPLLTQGVIQKALRSNKIKLNGTKIKDSGIRLVQHDVLDVCDSFAQYNTQASNSHCFNASIQALSQKILSQYLIFSNDDFIVINKPAKIASQGGSKQNISIDAALQYLNSQHQAALCFKLVHRLDKETSGVMLIAKHYDAAVKLSKAFVDKKIYKTYLALVYGRLKTTDGLITLDDELTEYRLLNYIPKRDVSLIEFKPITGKEHQIRRHALQIGVSIIGDKKYGVDDKQPYMLLHSSVTILDEVIFGQRFKFESALPEYFKLI